MVSPDTLSWMDSCWQTVTLILGEDEETNLEETFLSYILCIYGKLNNSSPQYVCFLIPKTCESFLI